VAFLPQGQVFSFRMPACYLKDLIKRFFQKQKNGFGPLFA
jgi:hypothetical protein